MTAKLWLDKLPGSLTRCALSVHRHIGEEQYAVVAWTEFSPYTQVSAWTDLYAANVLLRELQQLRDAADIVEGMP